MIYKVYRVCRCHALYKCSCSFFFFLSFIFFSLSLLVRSLCTEQFITSFSIYENKNKNFSPFCDQTLMTKFFEVYYSRSSTYVTKENSLMLYIINLVDSHTVLTSFTRQSIKTPLKRDTEEKQKEKDQKYTRRQTKW